MTNRTRWTYSITTMIVWETFNRVSELLRPTLISDNQYKTRIKWRSYIWWISTTVKASSLCNIMTSHKNQTRCFINRETIWIRNTRRLISIITPLEISIGTHIRTVPTFTKEILLRLIKLMKTQGGRRTSRNCHRSTIRMGKEGSSRLIKLKTKAFRANI